MNHIYKVIWSKAKHAYVVTSEVAKSHTKGASAKAVKTALAAAVGMSLFVGGYTANAAPATNPAGTGDGVAVGTGSSAPKAENVAIGKGATISYSGGVGQPSTGDIVIGGGAHTNNYIDQGGGIAIGANSFVENMVGGLERSFDFKQAGYNSLFGVPYGLPKDPTKMVTGVAIGQNTYARSGSVMLGTHNYKGKLGDAEVDSANTKNDSGILFSTTLGVNSYANGLFSSITGAYSIASSDYSANIDDASKNFGATITGSLNSIESKTASSNYSGVANSIVGVANRTFNSNGALVFGAGNEITNSVSRLSAPTSSGDSVQDLQKTLMKAVRNSNGGGATLAIGGGNIADYTQASQMIGVNNTLKGTAANKATYSLLNGYKNEATNVEHVSVIGSENVVNNTKNAIVLGDKRKLTEANGNIILGSSDTVMETKVADAAILGHNANVTVAGGVALGAKSVASTDKGVAGYDPSTKAASTETSLTWKSTAAAVSVGDAANNITRQITNVAAGKEDTDAVNVAQLKNAVTEAKTTIEAGENVTVAAGTTANSYKISAKDTTLKADTNALKLTGKTLSLNIEDTSGKKVTGSVDLTAVAGEIDTNTTYTMTGVENADNTTTITLTGSDGVKNEVKVASKDTRSTVKAGENVTITDKNNEFGAKEYTINVKTDGKVESGNTGIVSGGTVYNETHVKNDGTYVKKGNSAGDNLSVLDKQVSKNTDNITNLGNTIYNMNNTVGELGERINKVGAGAAALAGLHPLDFDPHDKWDIAAGFGNYRNASAAAVGLFYRPNERTMLNLGFTMGDSRNMVNAGVSVKLGRGDVYTKYSKVEMANRIEAQDKEIAALKAKDAERDAQMKDVLKQLEELRKGK